MFLLIRVFENSFTKFSIRYSEDSINHVEHVSVLVNAEQEWLTLYMKECLRFCGHVESNFWNIYRSEVCSYMEQMMQRNVLCPMKFFARNFILCCLIFRENLADFN